MKPFPLRFQFLKGSTWLCRAVNLKKRGAMVITQDKTQRVDK